MQPYHIACGSTDLGIKRVIRGERVILFDECNHCGKTIEAREINASIVQLHKAVSNIKLGVYPDETAKMIIESCRK